MDNKLIKEDISNMKFLMGYKAGKVISEQEQLEKRYGSFGNMKRPDFKGEMGEDLEFDVEETMESILEKHNLLDEVNVKKNRALMIDGKSSEVVQKILSLLPSFTELIFLAILNCESADFSDVDICSLPELSFINLQGTENNLEEQGYECIEVDDAPFYHIP